MPMKFNELGLMPSLLKAVNEKGYTNPSPIQEKAIPLILRRKDVLALAQTEQEKQLASHYHYYKFYQNNQIRIIEKLKL